jgi:hypothetical protein
MTRAGRIHRKMGEAEVLPEVLRMLARVFFALWCKANYLK